MTEIILLRMLHLLFSTQILSTKPGLRSRFHRLIGRADHNLVALESEGRKKQTLKPGFIDPAQPVFFWMLAKKLNDARLRNPSVLNAQPAHRNPFTDTALPH